MLIPDPPEGTPQRVTVDSSRHAFNSTPDVWRQYVVPVGSVRVEDESAPASTPAS